MLQVDVAQVVVRSFEHGVLVYGVIEVSVVHQKLLRFVDAEIGGDILVMEGTGVPIEGSQVILGHRLLNLAFCNAVIL